MERLEVVDEEASEGGGARPGEYPDPINGIPACALALGDIVHQCCAHQGLGGVRCAGPQQMHAHEHGLVNAGVGREEHHQQQEGHVEEATEEGRSDLTGAPREAGGAHGEECDEERTASRDSAHRDRVEVTYLVEEEREELHSHTSGHGTNEVGSHNEDGDCLLAPQWPPLSEEAAAPGRHVRPFPALPLT